MDELVGPLRAERAGTLEAAPRQGGRNARHAGQPAIERAVETSCRFPRSGSNDKRSGIHGASPTTRSTDASSATEIATAPPIEKPSSNVRSAPTAWTAARASSTHDSRRRHDFTRYRTSANTNCGKRGAKRCTSHSSDALQVPSSSALRPPFTHTTAVAPPPVSRISAPVERPTFFGSNVIQLRGRPESRAEIASHQRRPRRRNSRDVAVPPRPPPGYSGRSPATQMYRERGLLEGWCLDPAFTVVVQPSAGTKFVVCRDNLAVARDGALRLPGIAAWLRVDLLCAEGGGRGRSASRSRSGCPHRPRASRRWNARRAARKVRACLPATRPQRPS